MNESIEYLAPVILVCAAIAGVCFGLLVYQTWREWPHPQAWKPKYGTLPRRRR
jgi:uncharacterized protein (DUF2062 family)